MTSPLRTTTCPIDRFLARDLPLAEALQRLAHDASPLLPVAGSPLASVSTDTMRFAAQRGADGQVADYVDDELIAENEQAARAWMDADTSRSAVMIAGPNDAAATFLERATPQIDTAVVMAGGRGTRLKPLTDNTPKPLLEVGGRVLLYRILDHLRAHGVKRLFVSIHHLGDQVKEAIGDGAEWGMDTTFLEEDRPLDTGAGLVLLEDVADPFFVVNGDILTQLNLTSMGRWHQRNDNLATIATHRYAAPLPYGVVHRDLSRIVDIEEKPVYRYDINAGIYAFSPEVLSLVTKGEPLAMVDFLNTHARGGDRVHSFPIVEYWNDVGTHADFERAQSEVHEL